MGNLISNIKKSKKKSGKKVKNLYYNNLEFPADKSKCYFQDITNEFTFCLDKIPLDKHKWISSNPSDSINTWGDLYNYLNKNIEHNPSFGNMTLHYMEDQYWKYIDFKDQINFKDPTFFNSILIFRYSSDFFLLRHFLIIITNPDQKEKTICVKSIIKH